MNPPLTHIFMYICMYVRIFFNMKHVNLQSRDFHYIFEKIFPHYILEKIRTYIHIYFNIYI